MTVRNINFKKGFTLIELLVVIAVLGVLATAVIALVNPAKRLNQSKDSKIKNDIGVIARTMQAYYTNTGASGGTQYYPALVSDISGTGKDFTTEPLTPAGASYTVVKTPGTCTTAAANCTNIAVYGALNDPLVASNVWCWRSSNNTFAETTVAACTAP